MFAYDFDGSESTNKPTPRIISEGKNHFVVISAENCISKAGNDQLKVVLKCTDEFGITNNIYEYFPALAKFKDKLKGFLAGCGMQHLYSASGMLDESLLVGCTGTLHVKHETQEKYGLQARVKFYYEKNEPSKPHHVQNAMAANQPPKAGDDWDNFDDDEIPF
jgi:hypothetical protein